MAPRAEMPLFPCEADIARAVLGPGHVNDWKILVPSLERQGLPRIDPLFGGRYWPAVKLWFDRRAGITNVTIPARPRDGDVRSRETWS